MRSFNRLFDRSEHRSRVSQPSQGTIVEKLIQCLTELEKLKTVERGLNVGLRKESSAEHSWSCMLIADILIDHINEPLDRLKVLEFLLYHDIVEVYAGDAKFNNPEEVRLKHEKEAEAMKRIVSLLPDPERYESIIAHYENRTSKEAQFAKAVDCIDALVRNLNDEGKSTEDGFTEALIRDKYVPHVSKFEFVLELFEVLIGKLKQQNKL